MFQIIIAIILSILSREPPSSSESRSLTLHLFCTSLAYFSMDKEVLSCYLYFYFQHKLRREVIITSWYDYLYFLSSIPHNERSTLTAWMCFSKTCSVSQRSTFGKNKVLLYFCATGSLFHRSTFQKHKDFCTSVASICWEWKYNFLLNYDARLHLSVFPG